ncbi:hypothetical protein O0I10_004028 [Lichtheimia ornata]|uniref:Uncharacterized protein n=1 Tax=Lichtheimia ornata TaxID=688661 RepID=A0AAD7XWX7_9FUNG|nr:uncharacterized protein O0I10_004028 [Lichtheimia ornata]KAJ8660169.1 hypothetical protein O0I10_004028 [Lichtheimia ornata]
MRSRNAPEVAALPRELQEFIDTFDGKDELNHIGTHLEKAKARVEASLLRRVWSFIYACFEMTNIIALSGEKASKAASERINHGRTLAAVDPMIRKKNGVKVDMLFSTARFELRFVEALEPETFTQDALGN